MEFEFWKREFKLSINNEFSSPSSNSRLFSFFLNTMEFEFWKREFKLLEIYGDFAKSFERRKKTAKLQFIILFVEFVREHG